MLPFLQEFPHLLHTWPSLFVNTFTKTRDDMNIQTVRLSDLPLGKTVLCSKLTLGQLWSASSSLF